MAVALWTTGTAKVSAAQTLSPNGFVAPECTWFVDAVAGAQGWKLQFSGDGRDAYKWPQRVKNGRLVDKPQSDSIIVFKPGPGIGDLGHLGWVVWVNGNKFGVVHTKWTAGPKIGTLDGVEFIYTEFQLTSQGHVCMTKPVGWRSYLIDGFILRK